MLFKGLNLILELVFFILSVCMRAYPIMWIIYWSMSQVYQARLRRNGKVVAVKVQRPGVRAAIALDTLILRYIAGLIKKAGRFNSDLQVTLNLCKLSTSFELINYCLLSTLLHFLNFLSYAEEHLNVLRLTLLSISDGSSRFFIIVG